MANDEADFAHSERRRMRRDLDDIRPINLAPSRADADPIGATSVDWASVGGLQDHITVLKETVMLPLLYPDLFRRLGVTPPRGVLFHGPPGTGKTLCARALASASSGVAGRSVAFFMRKGADCLSKWVGEAERQLRLLFEQARRCAPSVIFFDEIDGLAPVRSAKQDQIHASIVSTLLALMDGLDDRGQVVVIGATNRPDAVDPALRRPGRFDRELAFPLPNEAARLEILTIHTASWRPALNTAFLSELAAKTVGCCGADLRALCAEAALLALRRQYPQVYTSTARLKIDAAQVIPSLGDFAQALRALRPAALRSGVAAAVVGEPLSHHPANALLNDSLTAAQAALDRVFPVKAAARRGRAADLEWDGYHSDNSEADGAVYGSGEPRVAQQALSAATGAAVRGIFRPRLLLVGDPLDCAAVVGALVHHLDGVTRVSIGWSDLVAERHASTPAEALASRLSQARNEAPSVIVLPRLDLWWGAADEATRACLIDGLVAIPAALPILLLADASSMDNDGLPLVALSLQGAGAQVVDVCSRRTDGDTVVREQLLAVLRPSASELRRAAQRSGQRGAVLAEVATVLGMDALASEEVDSTLVQTLEEQAARRADRRRRRDSRSHAVLETEPLETPEQERARIEAELVLTREQEAARHQQEERTLVKLRIVLRAILDEFARDAKLRAFAKPVDVEDAPDYYDIVTNPMDLSTMADKVDAGSYISYEQFAEDVDLIIGNANLYNPPGNTRTQAILRAANRLRDISDSVAFECDERMGGVVLQRCRAIEQRRAAATEAVRSRSRKTADDSGVDEPRVRTRSRAQHQSEPDNVVATTIELEPSHSDSDPDEPVAPPSPQASRGAPEAPSPTRNPPRGSSLLGLSMTSSATTASAHSLQPSSSSSSSSLVAPPPSDGVDPQRVVDAARALQAALGTLPSELPTSPSACGHARALATRLVDSASAASAASSALLDLLTQRTKVTSEFVRQSAESMQAL